MARAKFVPHPGKQTEFLASIVDRIFYGGARGGAHTLDSKVLTPFGFKRMGDIKIDDQVSNPGGSVSRVINVIPRGLMPIWEFTLVGGAKTRVTGDHLWVINDEIWQTKDILKEFLKGNQEKFSIPIYNSPEDQPEKKIDSIKRVNDDEAQCITVSNKNGLYICDDNIVTHNSKSFSLAWKVAFQPTVYYYVYENRRITRTEFFALRAAGKDPKFIVEKMNIHHPDFIGILIRRTHPQLQRNLKPETDKLYRQYGGTWKERHNCYVFPSGAKIYLVHCIDRKALDDYIGGNYNFIGIDEVNQFPEDWVEMLETSLRTDNPEIRPQLCLTSNPGNLGHVWLKKQYVDKCKPIPDGPVIHNKEFDVDYQPYRTAPPYIDSEGISRTFIPATVFDNPSIINNDKNYVRKLKQLTPVLRQMWLEGRWDVFAGMFFDMWDPAKHIISGTEYNRYKKFGNDDFNKNTHTLFRFYDYGTKAPFVCLFAAIGKDKRMIIFDEIVEKGMAASAQAQEVNSYTEQVWGLTQEDFADEICDPSYSFLTTEKDNERYSPLMYYEDEGIMLTTAARDRKIAAKVIYNALSGKNPDIRFTENCEYMIETLPNLPQKETDLEDVEDRGTDDHGYDALKYGATEVLQGGGVEEERETGWREDLEEEAMVVDSNTGWMGV